MLVLPLIPPETEMIFSAFPLGQLVLLLLTNLNAGLTFDSPRNGDGFSAVPLVLLLLLLTTRKPLVSTHLQWYIKDGNHKITHGGTNSVSSEIHTKNGLIFHIFK